MIITSVLCSALAGGGHLVRDGEPSYKRMFGGLVGTKFEFIYHLSTQLARVTGAIICGAGAALVDPTWHAALLGAAVLLGFYSDMKHGEGQGAATLKDAGYLVLSGVTSLLPLTAALIFLHGLYMLPILAIGIIKPAIWFFWNWIKPDRVLGGPWYFTRFAAVTFGLLVGALLALG